MGKYKCIQKQVFVSGKYSIVPIRDEDKYNIMQWRNEQIYHLRQYEPLTKAGQESYFKNNIAQLFEEELPNQILFSYLDGEKCIGYGGLVHINWTDKNAEISFIINTTLEKDYFEFHWMTFLHLIEKVGFEELKLHKIYTFAFDMRPLLYQAVEKAGFKKESVLKDHYFWENNYIDAVIHTKFNNNISIRIARKEDLILYYQWANDETVRSQSYNTDIISFEEHSIWFTKKIIDESAYLYIIETLSNKPVGQVRIEKNDCESTAIIGISIDKNFRGKGYASKILIKAISTFSERNNNYTIQAYIKENNVQSLRSFVKAGFEFEKKIKYKEFDSYLYIYKV